MESKYIFVLSAHNWVGESVLSEPLEVLLGYRVSPELTIFGSGGLAQIVASVPQQVVLTPFDESGERSYAGNDVFFLHVENVCFVTDNFRCDPSSGSAYTELPKFIEMAYQAEDDTYAAEYQIDRAGQATVSVHLARRGGLYAEYFNNAFLSGVPILTKVDSSLEFDW